MNCIIKVTAMISQIQQNYTSWDIITSQLTVENYTSGNIITNQLTVENYTLWNIITNQLTVENYTSWNIITNQLTIENYTSWNIITNQLTIENYTSWNINKPTYSWKLYFMKYHNKPTDTYVLHQRCSKLHLKMLSLPTCSDGWNRGVAHCTKVWGPCYLSPLSGRDSLVPLELACKGDIQPVTPDVTLNLITWNILIYCTKYTLYMKYTDILYQIYHIFQSCTRQSVPNILI